MASRNQIPIISEHILIEWTDAETRTPYVLGSCSLYRKNPTNSSLTVYPQSATGHIHICISLVAEFRVGGQRRGKEIKLVFLPHTFIQDLDDPLPFESLHYDDVTSSSILQQADLTNSGHIIRVRFNLSSPGCAVMRQSPKVYEATTSTSYNIVQALKSLSSTLVFNVYMRQSDYAKTGLQTLNQQLRLLNNCSSHVASHINLDSLYDKGRAGMLVNWDNFLPKKNPPPEEKPQPQAPPFYAQASPTSPTDQQVSEKLPQNQRRHLPPYAEQPRTSSVVVQVPRSPLGLGREEVLQHSAETVLVETPPNTNNCDGPVAPTLSQTSAVDIWIEHEDTGEGPQDEIGSDDEYYAALQAREASLDQEATLYLNAAGRHADQLDPDEEHYAIINAREVSLSREPSLSETLLSKVAAWFAGATTINNDVHKHERLSSRLLSLGYHASTHNIEAFHSTMVWCSAILFCDPLGGSDVPELWSVSSRWLISDIADLVKWSNKFGSSPEMSLPHLRCEFLKLGSAAQVAAKSACDKNIGKYKLQRAQCLAVLVQTFGRLSIGAREGGTSGL